MCKCLLSKVKCKPTLLQKQLKKGSKSNSFMRTINSIKPA